MSRTGDYWIRILIYIYRMYGPDVLKPVNRSDLFPVGEEPRPAEFMGFWAEATVEVESLEKGNPNLKVLEHFGELHTTFDEAQAYMRAETGITVEMNPGPLDEEPCPWGQSKLLVADFVLEFQPSDKPKEQVERESFIVALAKSDPSPEPTPEDDD